VKAWEWLKNKLAPAACPYCIGGSGTVDDNQVVRLCERCGGSGRANQSTAELQRLLDARFRRPRRSGDHAA
jgi:hypothetical protein